jgi:curved DNA-binding protein CbpA
MSNGITPYEVLGLTNTATDSQIRAAYFALVKQYPPEREPIRFQQIRAAYDALRTAAARAETDRGLLQAPPPFAPPRRLPTPDLAYHNQDRYREARRHSDLERADFQADFRPLPSFDEDSI